jgi:hypothetical protein
VTAGVRDESPATKERAGAPAPTPPLLCEHPVSSATRRAFRLECGACGSFWDLESLEREVRYEEDYPAQRGHFDPRVGALKVRSLARWLAAAGVRVESAHVCEVGFGGGSCLGFLGERAAHVTGIEANASAIDHVRGRGEAATLLLAQSLPARLEEPVDLWLFQDSFEHIPDPAAFMQWMVDNSHSETEILIVLPRADSLSRRLMGRLWPHKLPDHTFHWSLSGLIDFMSRRGFVASRRFFPVKFVSPQMVLAHLLHKAGAAPAQRRWLGGAHLALPFNFGEMGLLFRRQAGRA